MKQKLLLFTLLFALLLGCLPAGATEAPPPSTAAPAAPAKPAKPKEADLSDADTVLLYCLETDTVLRQKNAQGKVYPATAVKLMTALVAYERIADRTTPITVTAEMLKGVSGSYYGFKAGDSVSPEDLFKLLLLRKSNDAALILSHLAAGGVDEFVRAMNQKAEALGMADTFFTNPTGLHDAGMTTTAEDLLKLSLAVYSNNDLHSWSGAPYLSTSTLSARTIYNNNFFVSRYYNGTGTSYLFDAVDGLINGSTGQAGDVLITSAVYKGLHYMVILLGGKTTADNLPTCYDTTRALLEKDSQNFCYTKVLLDAEVVCELPVKLGSGADSAAVFPSKTLEYYLPKSLDLSKIVKKVKLTEDALEAPVVEGDKVGSIEVYLEGKLLGTADLVVRSNIVRSGTAYQFSRMTAFLKSQEFLIISLSVAGVFLLYFLANAIYREQVKKKKNRPEGVFR